MIECPIREGYQKALGRYEQSGNLAYLVEALGILDKSTPPANQEERIPWVNDLIDSYRQVSKTFQGYLETEEKPTKEGRAKTEEEKLGEMIKKKEEKERQQKIREELTELDDDLKSFRKALEANDYIGANTILESMKTYSILKESPTKDIVQAYSQLITKLEKEREEMEEKVEKAENELKDMEYQRESDLKKIGIIR